MLLTRASGAGSNVAYTMAQAQSTFAGWTANMQADPLLTNPGQLNFTLGNGSPAVNAGVVVGTPYQAKIGGWDLGAVESH